MTIATKPFGSGVGGGGVASFPTVAPQGTITGMTIGEAGATEANIKADFEKTTFTGNVGAKKYTIGDVVKALKELGLLEE